MSAGSWKTPAAGLLRSSPAAFAVCLAAYSVAVADGNFTCSDAALVAAAEQARVDSARFWTGKVLPGRWSQPCPISVESADHSGGGSTSFVFDRGEVSGWRMTIAGRRDALLADVVPHEVDHMVRASLVRRPIPRWLDEGCATLWESADSHAQNRQRVTRHLALRIDAAFLDATDYPAEPAAVEQLYAVGFSLVEYLLTRHDAAVLLAFQADARPPSRKLTAFYGLTAAELDRAWRPWAWQRAQCGCDCSTSGCARHGSSPDRGQSGVGKSANRPVLTVYTSRSCGPCRRFWDDYRRDARFRAALEQRFTVTAIDVDQRPDVVQSRQIEAVPAFETPSLRVYGYESMDWLLVQLGVAPAVAPGPAPVPRADVPAIPSPQRPAEGAAPGLWGRVAGPLLKTALALSPWGELIGVLGGTAATGGVGAIAIAAAIALWRRRRRLRRSLGSALDESTDAPVAGGAADRPAPFPRALDEARELLQLRQSEGRVAVLDALRGMVLDDELQAAATDADPAAIATLNRLRAAVDARVSEIAPLTVRLEE